MSTNGSGTATWIYNQYNIDTSTYKTGAAANVYTGTNGAAVSSTWGGCVEERQTIPATAFSFSSGAIISDDDAYTAPTTPWDLDIDSAPDSDDNATKWGPMWPEAAYRRDTVTPALDGNSVTSYCPFAAQLLREMDKYGDDDELGFYDYADDLSANGSTYLDVGMLWGARLSSPTGIFADNVNEDPPNGGEVSRHLIFMTDGEMQTSSTIQSTYGIESVDRHVTTDGSDTTADANHAARFRAICDAVKAKGIRIWVIAFTTGLNSDLSYCASDASSFVANDADQLNNAFQVIAKNVGELRIVS
jgi:hypothetical protein